MKNSIFTKTILSLAVISALASSASAKNSFYNEDALDNLHVNVGYSSIDLDGSTTTGINYGFGLSRYGDTFMFGIDYQFTSLADSVGSESGMYNMDFLVGYRAMDNLTPYALVGYSGIGSISGVSYGAGVKYQLFDYVALDARLTASTLSSLGVDLSTTQITAGVEFNFRTTK